ncbi:SCO-spondin-like [Athene noctua]|uniref:SCO-spondin-like n=1 Tax=Athene noctua TaxID=126797 RepID=UPI003EB83BB1
MPAPVWVRWVTRCRGRHWCEQTVQVTVEEEVTPRREDAVPCASLYRYSLAGWHIDQHRMRRAYGGDRGEPHRDAQPGSGTPLCYIYRPPEVRPVVWNRTVRACCQGWSGPRCTEDEGSLGRCYGTWRCRDAAGSHNLSAMSLAECCRHPWGHSWRNGSAAPCLACTRLPLASGSGEASPRPLPPSSLRGAAGRHWGPSASCLAWAGSRYRTFDGTHFHFSGECTYSLATAADGTWAVSITAGNPRALHMTFGMDMVVARGRNVSVNSLAVPEGRPFLHNGISVTWLGDWVAVVSGLGVRVASDGRQAVTVTVEAELRGGTRGLCGPYNDDPADDFLQPGGDVALFATSFGNSWKIPDAGLEPACRDAVELGPGCAAGDAVRQAAEAVCGKLLAEPFLQCHGEVDPGGFYAACLEVWCREGDAGPSPPAAVCDTFAAYSRECARHQTYIDWRQAGFCERRCGAGQRFSDCVSSCPADCAAMGSAQEGPCRQDCAGGCECAPGLYRDGEVCVPLNTCPCHHRRQRYSPGQSIRQRCNRCTCQGGRWLCSQDRCPGECVVLGGRHYVTFDHRRFSFLGACAYTLVQDFVEGQLLITAEHKPCHGHRPLGCPRSLSVSARRTSARLRGTGEVTVDGREVPLPFAGAELSVRRVSSSFLLLQTFGAYILWGLEAPTTYITLQPAFAGKVRGLCGTYSWNQGDEFTTPAGDVESGVSAFANTYRVSSDCPALGPFPLEPCGDFAGWQELAEASCAVLHGPAFQPCHQVVELEPFWQLCLHEACACRDGQRCLCPVLAAYARRCAAEGTELSWRNRSFCDVPCAGGQLYQECGRACGQTCAELHLDGAVSCPDLAGLCIPGCQCPPGLVLAEDGQCVPPSACPCRRGTRLYPPGSQILRGCNACICAGGSWRCTEAPCPAAALCPGGLVHMPGSCLRRCDGAEPNGTCAGIADGCVCPPGTLFLDGRCVSPEECPCHHAGRLYRPNDTIVRECNTCVCRQQRWHCGWEECAGTCVATGDPHYVTFDGRAFSFPGDCEYLLAREATGLFTITAENVPCGTSGVTCTKSVVVVMGNTVVQMLRGRDVMVNGVSVRPPKVYSGTGLMLERAGLFLLLLSRLGLSVLWDGGTRVYVRLEPQHRGRVAGLCGNFDGDAENDFGSRQGVLEPTAELFGNSWRVSLLCPEVDGTDAQHPCTESPHRAAWARRRCSVLRQRLFAPCHDAVPCQRFYDWCVFDACGCDSGGDCECLCTAIATYAEECGRRGVHIRWRSQELCPLQCDGGLEYSACGPPCPPTCRGLGQEPPELCQGLACLEGCFCPPGTLLHDGGCIEPAQCPCFWDGFAFPAGAMVQQGCRNCTCTAGQWRCPSSPELCPSSPRCAEWEFSCRADGRCVPGAWLCDDEEDCGDGSDELCAPRCAPHQHRCAGGQCLAWGARCDGIADCADGSDEDGCPPPPCTPPEFGCASGRCLPPGQVCNGELDCGFADDSDEAGCSPSCVTGEFRCALGRCVPYPHRCDGRDDCGDFSDEHGCVCPPGHLQCPDTRCLPPSAVCDGHRDCANGTDEDFCPERMTCAPGQLPCPDGSCIAEATVCDGIRDCQDGWDESPAGCAAALPAAMLPVAANASAAPACGPEAFGCAGGGCVPRGWLCDGEADCHDGSDELGCAGDCEPGHFPCANGTECVPYGHLCDGVPHCRDHSDESADRCGSTAVPPCLGLFTCDDGVCLNVSQVCDGATDCPWGEDEVACESRVPTGGSNQTRGPCAEYSCRGGECITFHQVCDGVPDCRAGGGPPQDELDCGMWGAWGPWGACTRSCGPGQQQRVRGCHQHRPGVLHRCRGPATQERQCFRVACPVDGAWSEWTTWSNCTGGCGGVRLRQRDCRPPQNGGRHCAELPGLAPTTLEMGACELGGCPNASACPEGLHPRPCAPCPASCADISAGAGCQHNRPCSPGCWCAAGLVLDADGGQCVRPRDCPCQAGGLRYRLGELVKLNCRLCTCLDGQLRRCRQNPDCTVHCGWSAWSPWGVCPGPCGAQSVQWSFRSPTNPSRRGGGRHCRGIYRKARRCWTAPCRQCQYRGRRHSPGERWRGGPCQVCQCLPSLAIRCSPYCPHRATGCPQGQVLVEARGDSCCYCAPAGDNVTVVPTALTTEPPSAAPAEPPGSPLLTFPLPPLGDPCYRPLGIASLPDASFTAAPAQGGTPAPAARLPGTDPQQELQGWAPPDDAYPALLSDPPFLQLDLLETTNITGVVVQGAGSSDAFVTAFLLQFSTDGTRWHRYGELFQGNRDADTLAVRLLSRMVQARHVRILPQDFHNRIVLRAELLGCPPVPPARLGVPTPSQRPCGVGEFQCGNGRCVPGGPHGAVCDGHDDCGDLSDELTCGLVPPVTPTAPGPCPPSQRCHGVTACHDGADEAGCETPSTTSPEVPAAAGVLVPTSRSPTVPPVVVSSGPGVQLPPKVTKPPHQTPTAASHRSGATSPVVPGGLEPALGGLGGFGHLQLSRAPPGVLLGPPDTPTPPSTPPTGTGSPGGPAATKPPLVSPRVTAVPSLTPTWGSPPTAPAPALPRQLCPGGRVPCGVLGCLDAAQLCDGHPDCPDGTDEHDCGETPTLSEPPTSATSPARPPPTCPPKQFLCSGGGCLPPEKRCDLRPDCPDGSDERGCADCVLSPWGGWGPCSRSCGLGVTLRRRGLRRGALPGGGCARPRLDTRACFIRACPVPGRWAAWGLWSPCDAECGGGVRSRVRSCSDPPPKNGGQPCPGRALQSQPCNLQPCGDPPACSPQMVFVGAGDCEGGRVPPCPPTCGDLSANSTCLGPCQEGCRCPPGLYLQDGGCVDADRCRCHLPQEQRLPGEAFLRGCRRCMCRNGTVTCEDVSCAVACGWSAWSPWTRCDGGCGVGTQERFRSPTNPVAAAGGAPCTGEAREVRKCHEACGTEHGAGWSAWTPWSECSAPCGSGEQRRQRACAAPAQGGPDCAGPHVQTRDCNTQPCQAWCPGDMVYQTAEECRRGGGPCPRLCLDRGTGVECAALCHDGCACPPGLLLQNQSCVPPGRCLCHHRGRLYQPGDTAALDACNNCTCVAGAMVCGTEPCPEVLWGAWSPWGPCSVSCGGGERLRRRQCQGPACPGLGLQSQICNTHVCREAGCPPGRQFRECPWGGGCPYSCAHLGGRVGCAEGGCTEGCHCPPGTYLHRDACLSECPCVLSAELLRELQNGSGAPLAPPSPPSPSLAPGQELPPGTTIHTACANCTCLHGQLRCSESGCRRDGGLGPWGPWSPCSPTCGGLGVTTRRRGCTSPPHTDRGRDCAGPRTDSKYCQTPDCPAPSLACLPWVPPFPLSCRGSQPQSHVMLWVTTPSLAPLPWVPTPSHLLCPAMGPSPSPMSCCGSQPCPHPLCCGSHPHPLRPMGLWVPHPSPALARSHPGTGAKGVWGCHCVCSPPTPAMTTPMPEPSPTTPGAKEEEDFGPWSPWTSCSKTCTHPEAPATKTRSRTCRGAGGCRGERVQQQPCNLPHCTAVTPCPGGACADQNCSWTPWGPWGGCSRSCGGGVQLRLRAYTPPGPGGRWCPDILSANTQRRFCSLQACKVDGAWSPWGPWSRCDRTCGGGRSVRSRSCTRPPPKNGGRPCPGERHRLRLCNPQPCAGGCPPGMELVACANRCPRHCRDLQPDLVCGGDGGGCEPGCRCPNGTLEQDGECVPPAHCECTDRGGHSWVPGSRHHLGCESCVCTGGRLQCSPHGCPPAPCPWSHWSRWAPCSVTCGGGQQARFRIPTPTEEAGECGEPQEESRGCGGGPCPPLCPQAGTQRHLGESWLQGECQRCTCTPEGPQCQDIPCADPCLWGPWGPWGPCQDPCSGGYRLRHRQPRHPTGIRHCHGTHVQTQSCNTSVCPGETCGERGRASATTCANGCPRACADLWPHVECLQGPCTPGCRCPSGQLLQDGGCVSVAECRCGLPDGNGSQELGPGQAAQLECHNCTCGNGTFTCPVMACPTYGPWSPWGPCSRSCGGGNTTRHRSCQGSTDGGPCGAGGMEEMAECNLQPCPGSCQLGPWSPWSPCSASCGGGSSERRRELLPGPEGWEQSCPLLPLLLLRVCNAHNCSPECPNGQVYGGCANACPRACTHLRPVTQCVLEHCQPGCTCPSGQVLQDGVCVPPELCRCQLPPTLPGAHNLSRGQQEQEHAPGSRLQHRCNTCICIRGTFNCSQEDCDADCLWSPWSPWSPCSVTCGTGERLSHRHLLQQRRYEGAECQGSPTRRIPCSLPSCSCPAGEHWRGPDAPAGCERSCQDISGNTLGNCSEPLALGCTCQPGHYRNSTGHCVPAALCECQHRGRLLQAGSEWQEECEMCRCVNGQAACATGCPPLACPEGAVKVREPGSCCPMCREEWPEEPPSTCRRITELRTIAKGPCALPDVEVSYCTGRCRSRTTVTAEEPFLQSMCECCSYRLDPASPVRVLHLPCPTGPAQTAVLPVIQSCQCSRCQGGDFSRR